MNQKPEASCDGARPDDNQLALLRMFFGIHPWTYLNMTSQELLAVAETTPDTTVQS